MRISVPPRLLDDDKVIEAAARNPSLRRFARSFLTAAHEAGYEGADRLHLFALRSNGSREPWERWDAHTIHLAVVMEREQR